MSVEVFVINLGCLDTMISYFTNTPILHLAHSFATISRNYTVTIASWLVGGPLDRHSSLE